ncbi:centrosomal protein of 290 kDa-like isoform X2 [Pomacea canaliculata]|nr:centrosomal protein of 290 kDa-like isoform X2 [Pomacea canaliculata]XP_025104672.1 centrosomal protein of 290 kDa-like isoform X2 [Pomacea canaliculata]
MPHTVDTEAWGHELQVRVEQVERSLASATPFTDLERQADIPDDGNDQTAEMLWNAIVNHRSLFRREVLRLRKELDDFRHFCKEQIQRRVEEIKEYLPQCQENVTARRDVTENRESSVTAKLNQGLASQDAEKWKRLQRMQDCEAELMAKEESLAAKRRDLLQYEQEIIEVESMLNHRHTICERRQQTLAALDEELEVLRGEMEHKHVHLQTSGVIPETTADRARKNWEVIRRNLLDRQHLLEATVNKYRSELAAATSALAGKDIIIAQLHKQLTDLREHLEGQDSKFEQMESQLLLGCAEGHPLQNGVSRGTNASQLLAVPTSDYIQTRRRSRDLTSRPRVSPSPSVRRESLRERPNTQWRSSHGSQDAWLTIPQNVNTEETFLTTRRPRSRALSVDVSPGSARKLSTGSSRFSYRDRTRKDSSNYSNGTANNQLYVSAMRKDSVQESSTCKIM